MVQHFGAKVGFKGILLKSLRVAAERIQLLKEQMIYFKSPVVLCLFVLCYLKLLIKSYQLLILSEILCTLGRM